MISFVCSIGNVPLAVVLWKGRVSFGGVVAFIFADLIIAPILNIYRKYYGAKMAAFLLGTFFAAMAGARFARTGGGMMLRMMGSALEQPDAGHGHAMHAMADNRGMAEGNDMGDGRDAHRASGEMGDQGHARQSRES